MELFVGIDVSKAMLDIAVAPTGETWSVPNVPEGMQQLVKRLRELSPKLVVLEATGGLERRAVAAIAGVALPVVAVNPRQVRDFAKAMGRLAKTDAIDTRARLTSPAGAEGRATLKLLALLGPDLHCGGSSHDAWDEPSRR